LRVTSRGLGDVYKRQEHTFRTASAFRTEAPPNLCTVICAMMLVLFVQ
jgi:hypothetical protein